MSRSAVSALLAAVVALAFGSPAAQGAVHTSSEGVQMIADFEGFVPMRSADPVGVLTVGYGHTEGVATSALWIRGQRTPGVLTMAEARRLLGQDLERRYEPPVRALFAASGPLHGLFSQHRFDALVSAAFNLGVGFVRCAYASICRAVRSRDPRAIARALLLYDHGGGMRLPGLTRRRRTEASLFLRPMGRFELFPSREEEWIKRFDCLRRHRSASAIEVRRRLRGAMARQAARIADAARRTHDWLSIRRRTRYGALIRRVQSRRSAGPDATAARKPHPSGIRPDALRGSD